MEHKKYIDINAYCNKYFDGFHLGDEIYIEEKIDGANASFQYNPETGKIEAFSRKTKLDEKNNLRGFYQWTQSLNPEDFKGFPSLRFFGEWLVSHTVPYPQDKYQNFYLFDIFDEECNDWLTQKTVYFIADNLNLKSVPLLYHGTFQSIEHCMSFVGQTKMGGEYGEGIVIKNMTTLNTDSRLPSYVKIVGDKFAERHTCHVKTIDPEKARAYEEESELVSSVVNRARVEKLINKFVDEDIIEEDWDNTSVGIIAKNLGKRLYEDCVKEANDVVSQCDNFGKMANSIGMKIVKEFAILQN